MILYEAILVSNKMSFLLTFLQCVCGHSLTVGPVCSLTPLIQTYPLVIVVLLRVKCVGCDCSPSPGCLWPFHCSVSVLIVVPPWVHGATVLCSTDPSYITSVYYDETSSTPWPDPVSSPNTFCTTKDLNASHLEHSKRGAFFRA